MSFFRAKVDVLVGNRLISRFMEAADLQCTPVAKKTFIIDYKESEKVDHERVRKAMDKTVKDFNNSDSDMYIQSYDNIRIELVEG